MKILISNDDGYLAPGLVQLATALGQFADVTVVAPDSNRSGTSSALTLDRPLAVQRADNGFYFVNGTPSDCVHIALTGLLQEPPDLIVSGINQGQNMGDDTLYSGTVAAATEGYLFGYPALAFSQAERGWKHLDCAVEIACEMIREGFPALPSPYLMNVNIPCLPKQQIRGRRFVRLGKRHASEPVIRAQDPHGRDVYWIGPPGGVRDGAADTDFGALAEHYVALTPLQIDLTNLPQLDLLLKHSK